MDRLIARERLSMLVILYSHAVVNLEIIQQQQANNHDRPA